MSGYMDSLLDITSRLRQAEDIREVGNLTESLRTIKRKIVDALETAAETKREIEADLKEQHGLRGHELREYVADIGSEYVTSYADLRSINAYITEALKEKELANTLLVRALDLAKSFRLSKN